MYDCPECSDKMIWQSDWDDGETDIDSEDYCFYTCWSCSACAIELIKQVKCGSSLEVTSE